MLACSTLPSSTPTRAHRTSRSPAGLISTAAGVASAIADVSTTRCPVVACRQCGQLSRNQMWWNVLVVPSSHVTRTAPSPDSTERRRGDMVRLVAVVGGLFVEDLSQRREVQCRRVRVLEPLPARDRRDLIGDQIERPPGRQREHLQPSPPVRGGRARRTRRRPSARRRSRRGCRGTTRCGRSPSSLATRSPSASSSAIPREVTVVRDPVVEPTRRLVEHEELEVAQAGQRRRVRHVSVQHAARVRHMAVQMRVEEPRGRIGVGAGPRGVEQQQLARPHAREVPPARIEEELPAVVGDGDTEMVGDALVEIEPGRPAERGRQLAAQRLDV